MKGEKITEIAIETDKVVIIQRRGGAITKWCTKCGDAVGMVTPDEASLLLGISSRAVYQLVEADAVHYLETGQGMLLICLKSISG